MDGGWRRSTAELRGCTEEDVRSADELNAVIIRDGAPAVRGSGGGSGREAEVDDTLPPCCSSIFLSFLWLAEAIDPP